MILQQLLGSIPTAVFIEDYFLKLPYSRPGGCAHLLSLGGWEVLGAILGRPGVDVLVGREGKPYSGAAPTSVAEAQALIAEGYTLGIRHAEQHHPALQEMVAGFRHDFAAPVDIHIYCTPANQPSFGWHYDAEDVFLLQLRGSKEWQLRKNTVHPWPLVETLPRDMRFGREIMPLMRCTLKAGDWMYIPAGYWHRGQAEEESVSLSVGLLSTTAMDALDFLRKRLLDSLRWRQRLPTRGAASPRTTEELVQEYRTLFAELGQDLAAQMKEEGLVRDFLKEKGRM